MKKQIAIILCSTFLLSSCLNEDDNNDVDVSAPAIGAGQGVDAIQPSYFFTTDPETEEVPLNFSVSDETGIQEIKINVHSGFDGHTHGKSTFARNPSFKLFTHNEVISSENFEDPKQFSYSSKIYLDERNENIKEGELYLSGPYHFSIQATDVEGNQTSYGDNSTYHTTVYLNTMYAPQATVTNLDIANNAIGGRVYQNTEHKASSEIVFLWIFSQKPNAENPAQEGTILEERIWGKSNWPHQFRPNEGEALPNAQEIQLADLLDGDSAFFSSLTDAKLMIWAEDSNGNITVNQFN
ncbi:DUF4625 domain-containing protein [Galbibacter mesophilus]|uniref:DUF4625 domain-containing protein n=1 Tax=Galbibacter mesophilus TaxID=379069 RepID=UPI00191F8CC4|nr:DUF4625 domain-containing protein [Galbibacter mesophilus]MCM5663940.1 DUF4625 domain-containing protein [Galbibacter mesophilus]